MAVYAVRLSPPDFYKNWSWEQKKRVGRVYGNKTFFLFLAKSLAPDPYLFPLDYIVISKGGSVISLCNLMETNTDQVPVG